MQATRLSWTTGSSSQNTTVASAGVGGTDLGILWDNGNGAILSMWGDTFSDNVAPLGTGADWRFNVLARSTNTDYQTRGLVIDWWNTDRAHHARLIINKDFAGPEHTIIPTSGIAVNGRQFVSYMAIDHFGAAGVWYTDYAGLAWSDDYGSTWTKDTVARWGNLPDWSDNFQMLAFARPGDGYLYMYGTPNGRFGAAQASRVPESSILNPNTYRYWNGSDWVADKTQAITMIPGPVSELSIAYHYASRQWLAGYYHPTLNAMVVLTSPTIMGPWSSPNVVATATDYPGLYGFFFHPWSMHDINPCASMSQWPPYETELMQLTGVPGTSATPAVASTLTSAQGYTNIFGAMGNPYWSGSNNVFPVQLTDGRKMWIAGLSYAGYLTSGRTRPLNYQTVMNTMLVEGEQTFTPYAPAFYDSVGRAHLLDSRQINDLHASSPMRLDPVAGISWQDSLFLSVSWSSTNYTFPFLFDHGSTINGSGIYMLEIPLATLKSGSAPIRKSALMPSLPQQGAGNINFGSGFYTFDQEFLYITGRSSLGSNLWNIYLARVPLTYLQDITYVPRNMQFYGASSWTSDKSQVTPILANVGANVDIRYDVSGYYHYLSQGSGAVNFSKQRAFVRKATDAIPLTPLFTVIPDAGSTSFNSPTVYDVGWAKLSSGNRLGMYTTTQTNQSYDQTNPTFSRPHFFEYNDKIGIPAVSGYVAPVAVSQAVTAAQGTTPVPVALPAPTFVASYKSQNSSLPAGACSITSGNIPVNTGDLLVCKVGTDAGNFAINSCVGGGITWPTRVNTGNNIGSKSTVAIYTAKALTSGSVTVTVNFTNGSANQAAAFLITRWSGGNVASVPATDLQLPPRNPSSTINTLNANSMVDWIDCDWNAAPGNAVYLPSTVYEDSYLYNDNVYIYWGHQLAVSPGAQNYGLSAPPSQIPTMAAIEIIATG